MYFFNLLLSVWILTCKCVYLVLINIAIFRSLETATEHLICYKHTISCANH